MLSVPLFRSAADVMIMMEAKYCRYGNDDGVPCGRSEGLVHVLQATACRRGGAGAAGRAEADVDALPLCGLSW